ncbi:hypothetical protein Adu01nite_22300 [Paractinoplanes durhamensis]|uniref:Uncharacterized protein n=1 Tax=Paractinoplanes durhamensis TaxID=113563 RepID=A0ABQ3YTM9_9ACTN|nr:hypothetical protein Adu01nite_22300 [Actinoplanes durhamensis]
MAGVAQAAVHPDAGDQRERAAVGEADQFVRQGEGELVAENDHVEGGTELPAVDESGQVRCRGLVDQHLPQLAALVGQPGVGGEGIGGGQAVPDVRVADRGPTGALGQRAARQ